MLLGASIHCVHGINLYRAHEQEKKLTDLFHAQGHLGRTHGNVEPCRLLGE